MEENTKKKVDSDWKNQVDQEKQKAKEEKTTYHEPNFTVFLSSLGMQAMIAMGKIENPVTGNTEKNMEQARYLIDTLGILKNKTKGNLSGDETAMLDESLFNLRMIYIKEKQTL